MSGFWKPGSHTVSSSHGSTFSSLDKPEGGGYEQQTTIPIFNFSRAPVSQQRLSLPIAKHRRQILYALEKSRVLVIVGETGSGKSTQIPQFLLEGGWTTILKAQGDRLRRVVCTQPRRLAAITLARRVANERGTEIGNEVGYTVRFDEALHPDDTQVVFATDGILVREALSDPLLSKYSVVMVDEAHERNINSDVLLGILKKVRRKRPTLRIIVCSATIDAQAFLDYFVKDKVVDHVQRDGEEKAEEGTIISIDGRQHPVDVLYRQEPVADYIRDAVDTALKLHTEEGNLSGDVLCFLPSAEDIDKAIEYAEEGLEYIISSESKKSASQFLQGRRGRQKMEVQRRNVAFLPLYGTLPYNMQARIFQERKHGENNQRRVIFATNIAETSVTVPNVKYVIDSGFAKLPYFDATNGFERLIVSPISRASARQRAGRAGRVGPGKCFRLYNEQSFFKDLSFSTPPEILRTNLSSFVLTLKALGIDNLMSFDLMSTPSVEAMSYALETLYALHALDKECRLTETGLRMAQFPTEPRVSKMLLSSLDLHCSGEILSVAAALQVRNLFLSPRTQQQRMDFDAAMGEMVETSGDHVTYVNVLERDECRTRREEDCKSIYVNFLSITRAYDIREQLRRFLKRFGPIESVDHDESGERSVKIRKCVTSGFFFNVARLGNDGQYYTVRGDHYLKISNSSVLSRYGGSNEYIIFGETYDGSKGDLEMRSCSTIQGRWLRELAPHYWE